MSTNVPLTLTLGNLTQGAGLSPQQFAQAIVDRITAEIEGGNIFFGQMGGTEPLSPLPGEGVNYGLWLNENVFYAWDTVTSKYLPIPLVAGRLVDGTVFLTTIESGATADRTLATPDKDGTIALTSDIISLFGTQSLGAGTTTITIDWTLRKQAYIVLFGTGTTISGTGMQDGQQQDVFVENNATAFTATFPGVYWPAGAAPTITTASVGTRKIDHFRLWRIGDATTGLTLGETVAQNYSISTSGGSGGDVTPPTVSKISGGSTTIRIVMSELLQGGSLNTAGFAVLKNGVSVTVTSASASGSTVTLSLGTSFMANASVTVQYTGSSIKDLAGNASSAFGPSHVTFSSS